MATPAGKVHTEMVIAIPDAYRLHVYVCRRWETEIDTWMGALIVAAHNEDEAVATCNRYEGIEFLHVEVMLGVFATGETRVLYDDELR